jgi:hypothetical protein
VAGDHLFKSVDRGRTVEPISQKLTGTAAPGASASPSASALSESPRKPGVLWVGTDDGNLWLTQNDGQTWTNRSKVVHDLLPNGKPMWIGYVHASKFKDGRAYMCVDGHRSHDRRPYVFVTEDFGATWKSLAAGLDEDSVRCVYEDTKNEDLLYLGTETGMLVSLDRGAHWQRLGKPFPTVPVLDFDIQERDQDLILATHGRSVWVLDVAPLRALDAKVRKKELHLFEPKDVTRLARRSRGKSGHRHFAVPNPAQKTSVYYWLASKAKADVEVVVRDVLGQEIWQGKGKTEPGLHRVDWNLSRGAARGAGGRGAGRGGGGRGGGGPQGGGFFGGRGGGVPAGSYSVTVSCGELSEVVTIEIADSDLPMDVSWPRPAGIGEGGTYEMEEQAWRERQEEAAAERAEQAGRRIR